MAETPANVPTGASKNTRAATRSHLVEQGERGRGLARGGHAADVVGPVGFQRGGLSPGVGDGGLPGSQGRRADRQRARAALPQHECPYRHVGAAARCEPCAVAGAGWGLARRRRGGLRRGPLGNLGGGAVAAVCRRSCTRLAFAPGGGARGGRLAAGGAGAGRPSSGRGAWVAVGAHAGGTRPPFRRGASPFRSDGPARAVPGRT